MDDMRSAAIYSATVLEIGKENERFGWVRVKMGNAEIISHGVWAQPAYSSHNFMMPVKGDQVFLFFESGSWNDPFWFGVRTKGNAETAERHDPQEAIDNYPTSNVIKSPSGHTIEMNDTEGKEELVIKSAPKEGTGQHIISLNTATEEIVIEHGSGKTKIVIRKDGSMELLSDAVTWKSKDFTLETGNVKWEAGEKLRIRDANQNQISMNRSSLTVRDKRGNVIKMDTNLTVTDRRGSTIKMSNGNIDINAKGVVKIQGGRSGVVRANDRATPHIHTVVAPPGGGPCTVSPAIVSFNASGVSKKVKAG